MREFMNRLFGGTAAADLAKLPAVSVALFGKHPAWGDHIDNLGDPSEVLLFARDLLYSEGLNRQIGTGAWEKLPAERRLPAFDHFFVWYLGSRMITGVFWSSSDSRGRKQYPLIVAAETHRRHEREFVRQIQQELLVAKKRCLEATDQSSVGRAVEALRTSLQRFCPRQPPEALTLQLPADFQTSGDDLPRVLHELRGSCEHLSGSRWSAGANSDGASLIRVRLGDADSVGLLDWMTLVETQIHPAASLLGFAARAEGIGDILVGTPTAQNFYCLRAAPAALPFTSDIPFEIASGLRDYASALVAGLKTGQRPARTVFGDPSISQNAWMAPLSALRG